MLTINHLQLNNCNRLNRGKQCGVMRRVWSLKSEGQIPALQVCDFDKSLQSLNLLSGHDSIFQGRAKFKPNGGLNFLMYVEDLPRYLGFSRRSEHHVTILYSLTP